MAILSLSGNFRVHRKPATIVREYTECTLGVSQGWISETYKKDPSAVITYFLGRIFTKSKHTQKANIRELKATVM